MKAGLPDTVTNCDLIKEVMPFWYTLSSEKKITDLYTPANPSVPISIPIQTLQSLKIQLLPTITDGTGKAVLAGLIANAKTRATLVATILNLVLTNGYDGIDLDFENFAFVDGTSTWNSTQPNWVQFIQDLSSALHLNNKLLSVTTPVLFDPASGKQGYYVYAWSKISSFIDRLRIMTYDYSTSSPGPIGPISWTESAVQYAVSVIPASKVYVGVPGYGRDWVTRVDGTCPAVFAPVIKVGAKAATFIMQDAFNLASSYGVTPAFNPTYAESNFVYKKVYNGLTSGGLATSCTATRSAWYQDPKGYLARANLVAKYRLGGIAAWTIGMEDPTAMTALRSFAQSIAPDTVLGTISTDHTTALIGTPITVTGTFKLPDTRPIPGLPVRLEMKNSLGDWRQVTTGLTGDDGKFSALLSVGELTSFRLSSDGSWERLAAITASADVKISRVISWSPPSSIKHGVTYLISGQVQPKQSGLTLTVQDSNSTQQYLPITTDIDGRFTVTLNQNQVGFHTIRLMLKGDSKFADSASDNITLLVR